MKRLLATVSLGIALHLAGARVGSAQEMYVGEVRLFANNFCPLGWLQAAGQLLSISQNVALFSLIGTTYGGNGTTNFALPNLAGRAPYGSGGSPGQPLGTTYGGLPSGGGGSSALAMNWCVAVQGMYPSRP